ncbi:glycosyltransferase family 4 protein [Roseivirga sp. BDSF3-8]|uniref:glycosyltransferase family 4 protein n=1 Tax=Roseivirga sp. BDSF3-8 TaxID=3241598 RepID=UPI00353213E2
MKHILFVCNELPPAPHGGIGIFVRILAEGLVSKGLKVSVVGYDETVAENTVAVEDGISVHRLYDPYTRSKKILLFGRYYIDAGFYFKRKYLSRYLKSVVKSADVDIVESYDWSGPLWSHPGVPLIVRMHGAYVASQLQEGKRASKVVAYCEKRNVKMADKLIAVSNHIGNTTNKALKLDNPFSVIHNFVDTTVFRPVEEVSRDVNKVVYVGRIHERKGLFELFEAMTSIMKSNGRIHLDLYGRGEQQTIEALKESVPPEARLRIHFKGYVNHGELARVYSGAGIVVCPSRAEAFGLSAVEAMACGTPVLMTRETSGPEIIKEGLNGELSYLKGDDLKATLSAMVNKAENNGYDPAKIREHVKETYSMDVVLEQNLSFYQDLKQ